MGKSAISIGAHDTVSGAIGHILACAHERHAEAVVTRHLLASLLTLRYGTGVSELYALNDLSAFSMRDLVLMTAVWPSPNVLSACESAYIRGSRPFLLVPSRNLVGARQVVSACGKQYLELQSIEEFASMLVWSLAEGSARKAESTLGELFRLYNDGIRMNVPSHPLEVRPARS